MDENKITDGWDASGWRMGWETVGRAVERCKLDARTIESCIGLRGLLPSLALYLPLQKTRARSISTRWSWGLDPCEYTP